MPPQVHSNHPPNLVDFFSKEGLLAQAWPGFRFRKTQQTLSAAIAHTFQNKRWLLAESGTGTGKTLAYLVPALLASKRIVIATSTRTLQEQLFFRDMAMLESLLPQKPSTALLKGRRNYLCLLRFEQYQARHLATQPTPSLPYAFHSQLCLWAEQTETGERSEIEMPDNWPLWEQLSAGEENCLGHECPLKENCFLSRARKRAERAQLIVVNHALLFADLALKARLGDKAFFILPEYEALVVDEAHDMEAAATENFVFCLSNRELEQLSRDILRTATREGEPWGSLGAHLASASNAFFAPWVEHAHTQQQIKLTPEDLSRGETLFQTLKALGSLCSETKNEDKTNASMQLLARRIAWAEHNWNGLAFAENYVRWAQQRGPHWLAKAAPIDVGPLLQQNLYSRIHTGVLTSATLTTGQHTNFAYVAQRLGFQEDSWDSLQLPSPFDYSKQAALYLPAHMPPPDSPAFPQALANELCALISLFGGRTLALFTSLRQMQQSYEYLAPKLSVPALLQGSRPRQALLEAFVQTPSVLFGSHSFWEGVDIPGEALRLVTIDKIPFAVPTEPLTEARLNALKNRRLNPFSSYQLPLAALRLKQGFGRLIRNSDDCGVVALFDSRLKTKNYGEYLLSSLPRAKQLSTWMEVKHFHEDKAGSTA
ncbi:MAG: ATP-dependent DNA helicase [Proteobacteria bacterium]|nr:ATP-dependent DNA helicase [Cystobacterineae bacterium]MCL2258232.1 ATP-dependent DNA helicase [Cystobacterineae bacterium]MCL2315393.1 ATP-dependent DNA helicase [Pseudomonadota bacterium]